MSANFSLETIDYCVMSPAAVASPRYQDTPMEAGDSVYAKPTNTGENRLKRSRLQEYASLRESKLDERNYTCIRVQKGDADHSTKTHKKKKKKNYYARALFCVVIYITVTFIITSALLAYIMWNVTDLKKSCCRDCTSNVNYVVPQQLH